MKGQPLAYNKDNQEDKEPLFDAVDTGQPYLIGMVPNIEANKSVMLQATLRGFTTATDPLTTWFAKTCLFAMLDMVGQAVQLAVSQGKALEELSLEELNGNETNVIEQDIYEVLTLQGSIASRDHLGGTAPTQVRAAIARAKLQI